jgi:hypothetical protein
MNLSAREFQRVRAEANLTESSKGSSDTVNTVSTKASTRRRTRLAVDSGAASAKIMEKHEVRVEVRFD